MTAHDPSLGRQHGGLLSWLRFGKGQVDDQDTPGPPQPAGQDRRDNLRMRQLEEVGRFLSAHRLEISAATLAVAWNYLSGADSHLVRSIDRQVQARLPVTLEWLDQELGQNAQADEVAMLADLMQRLENNIDEFGKTSR